MSDVAATPLGLPASSSIMPALLPDIIVVQHESTFDPRLYGLPVTDEIAAFFKPAGAIAGRLHVDCFAAASWKSEFAFVTGVSALAFGPNNWRIFFHGAGRFRHTLPLWLRSLGYSTGMTSTARSGFLNNDAFYREAGVTHRIFRDDFPPPPSDQRTAWQDDHDEGFFNASLDALASRMDSAPRYIHILTNYNHGSHLKQKAPADRSADRQFALEALPMPKYGEYFARLAVSAAAYEALKKRLEGQIPRRPTILVRYGDHQPAFAAAITGRLSLSADESERFETFYAIEGIGFELDRSLVPTDPLDLAFLGTVLLGAAGLPHDPVFAARASLLPECPAGVRKRLFCDEVCGQGGPPPNDDRPRHDRYRLRGANRE